MSRRIAEHAFEEEFSAVMDKIVAYEDRLRTMSDAEFAQAVRDYAEKLIAETRADRPS
jgi:hypothetical protein